MDGAPVPDIPPEVSAERAKHDEDGIVSRVLFVLCGIGFSVAPAIYYSYVSVYAAILSPAVMGWMGLSVMGAGLVSIVTQIFFDRYFDLAYGSKFTYAIRILGGLFGLGVALLYVPYADSRIEILGLGIAMGLFIGTSFASINQLAVVVDTTFTKYVSTGVTIGQGVPILLSQCLDFSSADVKRDNQIAFAWVPACICFFAFSTFFLVVCCHGSFDASFGIMDGPEGDCEDEGEHAPLVHSMSSAAGASRIVSPFWFEWPGSGCATLQFVGNALTMLLMPCFTYFGSLELAHNLVLTRFGGELAGRVASHFIRLWDFGMLNSKGLVWLLILNAIRVIMLAFLMLDLFHRIRLGDKLMFGIVGGFYVVYAWIHSELNVLVVQVGPKRGKVEITRGMTLLLFSGQIVSGAVVQSFLVR